MHVKIGYHKKPVPTTDVEGASSRAPSSSDEKNENALEKQNTLDPSLDPELNGGMKRVETYQTNNDFVAADLYRDGELVKMPAASRDPNDPMNLSTQRKIWGMFCLSFFGALIASAELILGAALPVFALEYSPVPYKILQDINGFTEGTNPLTFLEVLGGPPIFQVYLLATMPVLMIGIANLALVPMAIAVGRRPVILVAALLAVAGAVWAGNSHSLGTHIGARCIQAVGAGSVESLIPFIIQDTVYVHERNTWISGAFALQGVVIIAIGFSAPYVIIHLSWRWLYFITAIIASAFLIGMFILLPETRYERTRSEMNGIPKDDEHVQYAPRTWKRDLQPYNPKLQWKKGWGAFMDTLKTFFYPSILFVTLLNGSVIASAFAAGFTAAPALLTQPWSWPFFHLGLCLVPVLIAALFVPLVTGAAADWFANRLAKTRGQRVPENQLINLFLPWLCSLLGSLLYGLSGHDQAGWSWVVFLLALGFMCFGFLGTSTITTVYVLESYPHMAGPALVNVASFRWIMAFLLTLFASDWIVDWGYKDTFLLYTAMIAFFGLFIPVIWYFGPALRKKFPGNVKGHGMPTA